MDGNSYTRGILFCIIFIAVASLIAPVSAAETTISPGMANIINMTIANATAGDTIILNNGIYNETNIFVDKNIILKASTGHGSSDTIIDSYLIQGSIFNVTAGHSLTIESLALRNGTTTGNGGAINTVTGSTISVVSSTFTNCSADSEGGAISTDGSEVIISGSYFTDCTADSGGAIYMCTSGNLTITTSTFTGCKAPGTGVGDGGGAIFTNPDISITISSTTFNSCSAINGEGGGVYSQENLTVTGSNFISCFADGAGGAIYSSDGSANSITSSTFSNCYITNPLGTGGAVFVTGAGYTITTSTFSNCSSGNGGGAICSYTGGIVNVHFSRICNCSTSSTAVNASFTGTVNADNNWWGSSLNPSGIISGSVTVDKWLILRTTASPSSITSGGTSTVSADLTYNSDGEDTSGSGHVPDGIPVTFIIAGPGSISSSAGVTSSGKASTTFSSSSSISSTVSAKVDDQTASVSIETNSGGGSTGGGGSNTNTGVGASQNMKAGETATFNFEGKGAVEGLYITVGENTQKLMVTVKSQSNTPSSVNKPDNDVYEYEQVTVYHTDSSGITGGTFDFSVSKSWLKSNGYDLGDVVMLHYNEETEEWSELTTTFTGEDGTYYYYNAETPSFSWFAIAESKGATIIPEGTQTSAATEVQTPVSTPVSTPCITANAEKPPEDTQVTGESKSPNSLMLPLLAVVFIILITAVVVIRRRQKEYPDWWNKEIK